MDRPAEQDKPERCGENELKNRFDETTLQQLPQARDEEAAESGENVSRRTLTRHC